MYGGKQGKAGSSKQARRRPAFYDFDGYEDYDEQVEEAQHAVLQPGGKQLELRFDICVETTSCE